MRSVSFTESRARFAEVLDGVVDDREEVVITRGGHEPVVIVALGKYQSLKQPAYLMRSPANARRLIDAMERLEAGRWQVHGLLEDVWALGRPLLPVLARGARGAISGVD